MRPENVARDLRREPDDLYPLVELIERWDTQLRLIRGNVAEAGNVMTGLLVTGLKEYKPGQEDAARSHVDDLEYADGCIKNVLEEMRELVRGML